MMSQNRQNEKDRYAAQCDFECNQKAEEEIRILMDHLAHQDLILVDILTRIDALQAKAQATVSVLPGATEPVHRSAS
jgi:uncharacterized membrane protein